MITKIPRDSEFCGDWPMTFVLASKMFSVFQFLQEERKTKRVMNLGGYSTYSVMFYGI